MPDLILAPPTFAEGQTIETNLHGKTVSIFWRDEDTLIVDGAERTILLTEWDADSIGFALFGEYETDADYAALVGGDPDAFADALSGQFAKMREQAAAQRAEQIESVVAEVARLKAAELGRPLSREELAYVRKLARERVVGRTD
jgi:hypothetical protein